MSLIVLLKMGKGTNAFRQVPVPKSLQQREQKTLIKVRYKSYNQYGIVLVSPHTSSHAKIFLHVFIIDINSCQEIMKHADKLASLQMK